MATSAPPVKRVFVLGAGFSTAAGFPLQREILDRIKRFRIDIMTVDFRQARKDLLSFLRNSFGRGQEPSLEDIFTLLDQTIGKGEAFAGDSPGKLEKVRAALKRAILLVFHQAGTKVKPAAKDYYQRFATFMIECRVDCGLASDTIAVVSLNWDSLLEDSLYERIRALGALHRIDIDYCCYTTPLGPFSDHFPSIQQKVKGIFNIKVMKLHGSTNWLVCPNCKRLYTGVGGTGDVWELYVQPQQCQSCLKLRLIRKLRHSRAVKDDKDDQESALCLEPFFITPTFVKIFDNAHIQSIWHNAYVNLAEASEVVFIGYSLPEADYHVRTLLRRAIRRDAKIVVVLKGAHKPKRKTSTSIREKFAAERYQAFFGPDRVSLDTRGVQSYFDSLIDRRSLARRTAALQDRLKNSV